jgi:O-methyltransferase
VKFRSHLSAFLNRQLSRLGYALIRIGRSPTRFSDHLGVRYAYEDVVVTDIFAPWAIDNEFLAVWKHVKDCTLVDIFRCYELYQLIREVADIPGDILEVGVWRGGTGAILGAAASRWKLDSQVWLCDTFSGVVKAGIHDPSYQGGEHSDTSRQVVVELNSRLGLDNITVLAGSFPEESSTALGNRFIAFCHIDVDVYQSGADVVAWVLPRMQRGAMLVFDDYGFSTCKGITHLVHELRADGNWRYVYNLNKHAILIKR